MAITIDWGTKVISVPQADLTPVSGTLYELDTNWLRLELKALEAGDDGMTELDTHDHNAEYTVAGVTYARKFEIINGYSLQFLPDAQWSVRLAGSNNNLFDIESGVLIQNQVQVIANNSAGLTVPVTPGAVADAVLDAMLNEHETEGSVGEALQWLRDRFAGEWKLDKSTNQMILYRPGGVELMRFNLFNALGEAAYTSIIRRVPV